MRLALGARTNGKEKNEIEKEKRQTENQMDKGNCIFSDNVCPI